MHTLWIWRGPRPVGTQQQYNITCRHVGYTVYIYTQWSMNICSVSSNRIGLLEPDHAKRHTLQKFWWYNKARVETLGNSKGRSPTPATPSDLTGRPDSDRDLTRLDSDSRETRSLPRSYLGTGCDTRLGELVPLEICVYFSRKVKNQCGVCLLNT